VQEEDTSSEERIVMSSARMTLSRVFFQKQQGGGPMSAIAKNPVSHVLPSTAQRAQAALPTSPKFIRTIDLNEMRQLSEVAKFLILVAAPGEDLVAQLRTAENELFTRSFVPMNAHEVLSGAATESRSSRANHDVLVGNVKVNFSTMEADRGGEPLLLTALEFKTLKYLVENARRVISRDELLNEVWGYNNYPSTRTVDNQVAKLRKKLEQDPARPVHLRTVHGAGYKFLP
jgi:DNA-binding response OmpR family regulator